MLGDRELDVMNILWDAGSGTVTTVRKALRANLAYTTVLTILRNLEEKAYVSRISEGRAHRYYPRIKRDAARRSAISRVVDTLFHGAPEDLIVHMVEDRVLSDSEIRRLRSVINASHRSRAHK